MTSAASFLATLFIATGLWATQATAEQNYGGAYAKGLSTCVALLDQGNRAAVQGWTEIEPQATVCEEGEICTAFQAPQGYPVVFLRDDDTCFGSWTARIVIGPDEPISAVFSELGDLVGSGRFREIAPRPYAINLRLGIDKVYAQNTPPLEHLHSYVGCDADGATILVNFYAHPERLTRFETARLPEDGPHCIAMVS